MNINDKRLSIFKALLDHPKKDLSVSEIAESSEVPQPTVSRIVKELEEENILETQKRGNMKFVSLKRRDYIREIVRAISDKNQYLKEAAEEFSKKLADIKKVRKVILFGSVARGTADFESDIDVLVLVSDTEVEEKILLKAEKASEDSGFHISPTIMETETYNEHLRESSQFSKSVERDKVILYEE